MIREIRYKISEDTKSIEPKTRQWAGMQYEDNATEVVFDISALGITNALCRIDFNSAGAGYQPSENLEFKDDCLRRAIPKHITQYGGEIQVTAVITVLDETGAVTGEALSWPVIVYLTAVDKSEEGSKEIETNISEIETSVRKAQEEVEETADKVAGMHHELQKVYLTADEIVEIKRDAEELIKDIETKLENGEFKGEKGDSGVYVGSGEMPEDCNVQIDPNGSAFELPVVDIVYSPTSPNPQSGIAVAEAMANLGSKPVKLMSAAITQEAIDTAGEEGIKIMSVGDENINLAPYSEILIRLNVPKNELNTEAGELVVRLTGTSTPTTASGAYLLKTQSTSISTACGISASLATVTVVKALFDNDTFICGEVLKNGYGNSDGYAGVANGWTCAHGTFKKSEKKYVHVSGNGYKFPVGTTVEVYGR